MPANAVLRVLLTTTILTTAGGGVAFAQTAGQPSADEGGAIAEVIVTARRREESLQSTPVTVTAFAGEELQAKSVTDVTRLLQISPGVNFDAFPRAAPRPFFRGIGSSNQGAGGDPSSVGFLDGVYLGRSAMLGLDFYDLERVEVLKGPQGTLFGKNVVGGAINFITNKPVHDFEANAEATFGEYGQKDGHLMINAPLGERVAARLVLGAVTNDGYRHTSAGLPLDDDHKLSARLQTLFDLGEGDTLLLAADVAKQNLAQSSRFNVRLLPYDEKRGFDNYDKPRVADPDRYGYIDARTGGARAEYVTDRLGFATLTAMGSWRFVDYDSSDDIDGASAAVNAANGVLAPAIQALQAEYADSWSGELRLNSTTDGPLTWVAGLYANRDEIERDRESQTQVTPTTINLFSASSRNRSYAAFGELQYRFAWGLGVFGGARYTDEKKLYEITRYTGSRAAPTVNYTTVGAPGRSHEKIVTWRVGGDYRFSDNVYAFATVSTGFKSGAFPEQPGSAVLARLPTAPEKVTNYEGGLKTDWLGRRLRANVTVFEAEYTDLQTIQVIPDLTQGPAGTRVAVNSADATTRGVETEVIVAPVRWFDATVRYSYLDAHYDRFIQTSSIRADGTAVESDRSGNQLTRTPEHAVVVDVGLNSPEWSWGRFRLQVSADYQSQIFDDAVNDRQEYRRPRTLYDASLTFHPNEQAFVRAWVKNLTDVEYRTWQVDQGNGMFVQYGPPRQFGVTLGASF
ncbi:TonB-dependent receptor [Phenylobacterium sp. VNQ135]|uniref:TonB-dependent receptor n=1 Tax=Phenylobacterium sp. VNQ135 TaxID=3400922 RepID=UPI003C0C6719